MVAEVKSCVISNGDNSMAWHVFVDGTGRQWHYSHFKPLIARKRRPAYSPSEMSDKAVK